LQLRDAAVPLATGQADVCVHPHQHSRKANRQLRPLRPSRATPRPDPLYKYSLEDRKALCRSNALRTDTPTQVREEKAP
jgi:hypothetical protein